MTASYQPYSTTRTNAVAPSYSAPTQNYGSAAATAATQPGTPGNVAQPGVVAQEEEVVPPPVLDSDTLNTILEGIESEFGLTREQMVAGEGEAADLYRFILANLGEAQIDAEGSAQEGNIGRGILRSGLAVEENAKITNSFSQQRDSAIQARDAQLQQIAFALQQLDQRLANTRTEAAVDFVGSGVDRDELLAQALELV